mmetsp:Transcript_50132/g.85845  ORF Transcript_50132/g.85845 Transcript_50132/m.85845 type:complete len:104 (-) Transcript_50132:223-534(-)
MMTLYRKRIVRGRTHMVVYSLCLVLSAFHIVRLLGVRRVSLVALAFALRVNLPRAYSNKYAIWTLFLFLPLLASLALSNLPLPSVVAPVLQYFSAEAFSTEAY